MSAQLKALTNQNGTTQRIASSAVLEVGAGINASAGQSLSISADVGQPINIGTNSPTADITIGSAVGGGKVVFPGLVDFTSTTAAPNVVFLGDVTIGSNPYDGDTLYINSHVGTDITYASGANRNLSVAAGAAVSAGDNLTISAANGGATSGNGGVLTLQSGSSTLGTAGALAIDSGTGSVAGGAITIGGTNASSSTLGRSGANTTVNGLTTAINGTTINITGAANNVTGDTTFADDIFFTAGVDHAIQVKPNLAGVAGNLTVTGGNGTSGDGGGISLIGGDSTDVAAFGGSIIIRGGQGDNGGSVQITGGNSGTVSIFGGIGNANVAGGNVSVAGGEGGAGLTGADGGDLALSGGAAAATNGNGGDVFLTGGPGVGTGTAGKVIIGQVNTAEIDLSANTIIQSGATLSATGTGMINLPYDFQINGTSTLHNTPGGNDGVHGQVTAPNLNILTAGSTSDASALHTHTGLSGATTVVFNAVAGENIVAIGSPVFMKDVAGSPRAFNLDETNNAGARGAAAGNAVGLAVSAATNGNPLSVQVAGNITIAGSTFVTQPVAANVGNVVWGSKSSGLLTMDVSAFTSGDLVQKVGILTASDGANANTVAVQIGDVVLL